MEDRSSMGLNDDTNDSGVISGRAPAGGTDGPDTGLPTPRRPW